MRRLGSWIRAARRRGGLRRRPLGFAQELRAALERLDPVSLRVKAWERALRANARRLDDLSETSFSTSITRTRFALRGPRNGG